MEREMKTDRSYLIGALGVAATFAPAFGRGASAAAPTAAAPAITAGQILTPIIAVTKPLAAPKLSITFSAPNLSSGINSCFNPPAGVTAQCHLVQYYPVKPSAQSGTVVIQDPDLAFYLYAAPGDWKLAYAQIYDNAGVSVT
jgi:hypothetical protein